MNDLTAVQRYLLNKAEKLYWQTGEDIPVWLFIEMTDEGLDPEQLQEDRLH